MFGLLNDVEGECNAHMYLGDDYGDNRCTIRCHLDRGHSGPHEERCRSTSEGYNSEEAHDVVIQWKGDDRRTCR